MINIQYLIFPNIFETPKGLIVISYKYNHIYTYKTLTKSDNL